jgi:hypothetical protein
VEVFCISKDTTVRFDLFGLGQQGKSVTVSAQRYLNMYAELTKDQDKAVRAYYGTPGLSLFTTFGDTPVRGMIAIGDYIYAVHRGTLYQVDNAGTQTSRGTLATTSGRVSMAYNGLQIAIVDGTSMYCFTIASLAFVTVGSALFANPIDVTCLDGYGIACFRNSQKRQISSAADFTVWDALDFDSAESSPDNVIRVLEDHGELVSPGDLTVEFAGNSGGQDFPFSAFKSSTLQYGLAAPWSMVPYNDSIAGLYKNKMGQVQVMVMRGHGLVPISDQQMSSIINRYSTVSDATALSYMLDEHPMYQINFPTAGKSWLYDASTSLWSPLEYGLSGARHRGEILVDYLNKPRVSDYANGNIYTLAPDTYTDNGIAIKRQLVGRHLFDGDARIAINRLEVHFEAGVGLATGQGEDPQAMLRL